MATAVRTELARRQRDRDAASDLEASLADFHRAAWRWIDPAEYVHNWHIDAMAEHLEAVNAGEIRNLAITIPPRCMKSLLVSVTWSAWTWAQSERSALCGAHVKFVNIAYDPKLSIRDAIKMRRLINSPWYIDRWGDRFELMDDKNQTAMFENDKGGFRFSTSVHGGLTGEGGDILCVAEGELVLTPAGAVPIERLRVGDSVLAYDHTRGKVYADLITRTASRKRHGQITIRAAGGFSVRCSLDHPIFVQGRGYVAADEVRTGDRVVCAGGAADHLSLALRGLRQAIYAGSLRGEEGSGAGQSAFAVQHGMPRHASRGEEPAAMSTLRRQAPEQRQAILLTDMLGGNALRKAVGSIKRAVRMVRNALSNTGLWLSPSVLQSAMCERGPRATHDGEGQFSLHTSRSTTEYHSAGQTVHPHAGWGAVYRLRREGSPFDLQAEAATALADAPFGREPAQQRAGEPSDALRVLPQDAPSWAFAPVIAVQRDRGKEYRAYDLTVANLSNFFAGGILVHNCIDDPLNAKKAMWESARNDVNTWWDEALPTRLNDQRTGAKVIIMQRLHEDDLVGHVLDKDEQWVHLKIPMEHDPAYDTRTMVNGHVLFEDPREEAGELLWEERFPRDAVERLKTELGPFAASAQLAQQPTPKAGGIIDRLWWQTWPAPGYEARDGGPLTYPPMSFIMGSIDTAYGEKDEDAWNAMTVWGIWYDVRERPKVMLMEAWRKRLPLRGVIPEECLTDEERKPHWGLAEYVADTARRRKLDVVLIENKTRGKDLGDEVMRILRKGEARVLLDDPVGDKVARLHAVQAIFADGMVYAPNKAWADTVITEVSQFPKSKWKDYADTVSAGLSWMRRSGLLPFGVDADQENAERDAFRPSQREPLYDV